MIGAGTYLAAAEKDQIKINNVIRQLIEGRTNNVFQATLDSGAGSTTITSPLIGPNSTLVPIAQTANAAAAITTLYTSSIGAGTVTLAHGNNTNTDMTYNFVVVG